MDKNLEKTINDFIGVPDEKEIATKSNNNFSRKHVLDEREGLIERVDKILVTKDGKQLLREQY